MSRKPSPSVQRIDDREPCISDEDRVLHRRVTRTVETEEFFGPSDCDFEGVEPDADGHRDQAASTSPELNEDSDAAASNRQPEGR